MQAFSLVTWHGRGFCNVHKCCHFIGAHVGTRGHTWAHGPTWAHLGTLGHTWANLGLRANTLPPRVQKQYRQVSTETQTDTGRAYSFMHAHVRPFGHTWAHGPMGPLAHTWAHACKSNTGRQTLTLRNPKRHTCTTSQAYLFAG